jgi:hypothetical protein
LWNGKIIRRKRGSLPLNPSTHLLLSHFSLKDLLHPLPFYGYLQCFVHRCRRKEDPTNERGITKVMSCALVASTNLQKDLDTAKGVTGGASAPSAKMVGRSDRSLSWSAMVCGQLVPHDEGRSPPTRQGSPVPKVVDHARFELFPLVRPLGRSTDWSRLHVPLRGSSLRGR